VLTAIPALPECLFIRFFSLLGNARPYVAVEGLLIHRRQYEEKSLLGGGRFGRRADIRGRGVREFLAGVSRKWPDTGFIRPLPHRRDASLASRTSHHGSPERLHPSAALPHRREPPLASRPSRNGPQARVLIGF
jgi:hypothetical protein